MYILVHFRDIYIRVLTVLDQYPFIRMARAEAFIFPGAWKHYSEAITISKGYKPAFVKSRSRCFVWFLAVKMTIVFGWI